MELKINNQTPRNKIQIITNNQLPNCLDIGILNLFGYCILCLGYVPFCLNAQNITFTASCDRTQVALGETFTLEVKVSGDVSNPPNPELPSMDNFNLASTSRMQSIAIINGKASSEISFVYTLVPRKIGKFTIGSCNMKYKGQLFSTQPIEIEVVKSAASIPQPSIIPSLPRGTTGSHGKGGKDARGATSLFATLSVDKSTAYVNEQIILSFKFYQGINLLSSPQYIPPSLTGFWTEDLGHSSDYKVIDGRRYLVTEIRYAIFPTASGVYTISNAGMKCEVEDFDHNFFSFSFGGRTEVISASSVKIKVLDLPTENRPTHFSGAVGQYSISAQLDSPQVHQYEPAGLVFTISGTGNLKSIEAPEIPTLLPGGPADFKIYHSSSEVKLANTKDKISGKKIFNIIIIPEREGKFEIPGISFSFFNPKSGKYEALTTSPQSLTVLAGEKTGTYTSMPGQPIEVLGNDIHYIKTQVKLNSEDKYIYHNYLFLFIQIIPILGLLISLKYAKHREKLFKDIAYARAIRADKFARKGLLQCNKLLTKEDPKDFFKEVHRTLTEYIGGKLNISVPSLTLDIAIKNLKDKGVKDDILKNLKDLFTTCDLAKFGLSGEPVGNLGISAGGQEMKASYEKLSNLISELSKIL